MSVLVYIDHAGGKLKKAALEATTYASKVAQKTGGEVTAIALGSIDEGALAALGAYGATKVLKAGESHFDNFDAGAYTKAIAKAVEQTAAQVVIFTHNSSGKSLAPRVSARLKAGMVAGAIDVPNTDGGFSVRKSVFSGKAFADYQIHTDVKVISLNPNSIPVEKGDGSAAVASFDSGVSAADFRIKVLERSTSTDSIPLPEAELVVSAGRGLKGPENWGMIDELAAELNAATACSRPVSDVGWRPHHEHVGQTGITVRPNLYIAIGISGAIQHLAGVNNSKVIVVINKDSEAPFFKAADYGIVGDAFDVVPKLIDAVKAFKAQA